MCIFRTTQLLLIFTLIKVEDSDSRLKLGQLCRKMWVIDRGMFNIHACDSYRIPNKSTFLENCVKAVPSVCLLWSPHYTFSDANI